MTYKKYDPIIKKMIVETRNPDLFPEYKIPRTTALYWIKQSKEANLNYIKLDEQKEFLNLKKENFKLKAEKELLKKILAKAFDVSNFQSLLGVHKKEFIIKLIDEMGGLLPVTESVKLIGLTTGQYYRWRSEVYGCTRSGKKCGSTRPNQLTRTEQQKLVCLAKNKKYYTMSVKSLMYYAQREGILYCSYDSWRKYLKLNNVVRFKINLKKKKKYRQGIQAKTSCEIWHIDITEVVIGNNQKYYIQMIVDNFSRAIVSWKVSNKKNMDLSIKTIKESIRKGLLPLYLMSDGGKENVNYEVLTLLWGKGITQMIAQSDIIFSNSMIEAVFKKLKGVINFNLLRSEKSLYRKLIWFVKQYNHIIPHSKLNGASPWEQLAMSFNSNDFALKIKQERLNLINLRSIDFQKCRLCEQEKQ